MAKKEEKRISSKESRQETAKGNAASKSRFTKGTPVPVKLSDIKLVNRPKN